MRRLALLSMILSLGFSAAQAANTGPFTPSALFVSSENNYQVRLYGPINSICPAGFVYVNQSDPASKTYFAAMMLGYANGKRFNLTVANPDSIGACRILEFILTD